MGLFSSNKSKTGETKIKKKPEPTPKTAQQTLPFRGLYENGIMQVDDSLYSKVYTIAELNFLVDARDDQIQTVGKYMEFVSSFGPEIQLQLVIFNDSVSRSEFENNVLLPLRTDNLNEYREEMNEMLVSKMASASNNIVKKKYIVASVEAKDIEAANVTFNRIDTEIARNGQRVTGIESKPLTLGERMELMHRIYNLNTNAKFTQRMKFGNNTQESFSLKLAKQQGLTVKDLICPSGFEFAYDHFRMGDKFGRSMYLCNLPSYLRADILTELCNMPFNMIACVHYRSLPQDKAIKLLKERTININANVIEQQKRAAKGGYSYDNISPESKNAAKEVESIMADLTTDNQKLFMTTLTFTVFADSKSRLDEYTKMMQAEAERFVCQMKTLLTQQELGLNSSLPLGKCYLTVERMLNTKAAAAFLPFGVKELSHPHGIYYGLNAVSHSLLLYNRMSAMNGNGCILGTPGAGKSFAAKREMVSVLLTTNDDVFVIDPENEYSNLAQLMHGSVVRIAPGGDVHVNPMDMDLNYADEDDPVTLKSDFISSLCEAAAGSKYPLTPTQKTVVDRCVKNVYAEYVETLKGTDKTFDADLMPTLIDLYNELKAQPEPEARNMALTLERFVQGTQNTFAFKTNVDVDNRFTVFNIKDIGSGMKGFGLQVCLDNIWNRMIMNHKRGRRTWLYCDEFHLLTKTEVSAKYTQQIWKRARKWSGVPTGITQQTEDMLKSEEARAVIFNSQFIIMLNMDLYGRTQLQKMFNISDTELDYITSAPSGQGLIYNGTDLIPFVDEFPKDTQLYKAMTTKPDEVKEFKAMFQYQQNNGGGAV